MRKAVHIIIKGRVQGVGYRWFAKEAANRWHITGFVRNLPNGDVEVTALGEEADLEHFITELRKGPPFAHVLDLQLEPLPADGLSFESFSITF